MRIRTTGGLGPAYMIVPVGTGMAVFILAVFILSSAVWLASVAALLAVVLSGALLRVLAIFIVAMVAICTHPQEAKATFAQEWRRLRAARKQRADCQYETISERKAEEPAYQSSLTHYSSPGAVYEREATARQATAREEIVEAARTHAVHSERAEMLASRRRSLIAANARSGKRPVEANSLGLQEKAACAAIEHTDDMHAIHMERAEALAARRRALIESRASSKL